MPPRRNSPPSMYRFEGDSYRPNQNTDESHYQPNDRNAHRPYYPSDNRNYDGAQDEYHKNRDGRRGDFTFRSAYEAPRSKAINADTSVPQRRPRQNSGPWQANQRYRKPIAPHERPLLQSRRETTPEQMLGMGDGSTRFIAPDDVSASEAEMELGSDADEPAVAEANDTPPPEDSEAPSHKKTRVHVKSGTDGNSVPKWSNPDPYTVLPPPDETQAKKRDVVQLIRKAKIAHSEAAVSSNPVADNDDFISFSLDTPIDQKGAPSSGTSFSHREQLHPDSNPSLSAPGVTASNPILLRSPPRALGTLVPVRHELPPRPPLARSPLSGSMNQVSSNGALDSWPPPDVQVGIGRNSQIIPEHDLPQQHGRKRKRVEYDGQVTVEWMPQDHSTATPWCTVDHSRTENMGHWLHKEICDFYDFVKPHSFENAIRNDLVSKIEKCLKASYPEGNLYCFGSFAAGLYLPTADMDLVFVSNSFRTGGPKIYAHNTRSRTTTMLRGFARLLNNGGIAQSGYELISGAKVPIIKFVDRTTGLKVDLSFEKLDGVVTQKTFEMWKTEYPSMPILVTLVKHFLLMRGLNEVHSGGLGGFSVICLVVSMLQQMPSVQSKNMNQRQNLGELFMEFLDLYGNKFNLDVTRIRMDPAGYETKGKFGIDGRPYKQNKLSIVDPNRPDNDISGGSSKVNLIFRLFSQSFYKLRDRMADLHIEHTKNASILEEIFAGNYSSFEIQRDHLHKLYAHRRP